jgi:hypothetical protein
VTDCARPDETETGLQEENIENLRCANSKSQKEIDVATLKSQNLMKETRNYASLRERRRKKVRN